MATGLLFSGEDDHFTSCDESPPAIFLLNKLESSIFNRWEFLAFSISGTCNCLQPINRRKFMRNEANLLHRGGLLSRPGVPHHAEEFFHLLPPFNQGSVSANIISILIPKIVEGTDVPLLMRATA